MKYWGRKTKQYMHMYTPQQYLHMFDRRMDIGAKWLGDWFADGKYLNGIYAVQWIYILVYGSGNYDVVHVYMCMANSYVNQQNIYD